MRYDAQDTLAAPARPSAHPLRLLAGVVLLVLLFLPMAYVYAGLVRGLLPAQGAAGLIAGQTPLAVIVLLGEFAVLIAALAMVLRGVHGRGLGSLLGPGARAARQFARCVAGLLPLYLVFTLLPMPPEYRLSAHLAPAIWLFWLPLALPALMVQIGAEELVFRGYLQSQLAARFRHPAIWIGLPALLFGLVHFSSGMAGANGWALVVWAGAFGLAAADLTARSGTLGPAMGLHFTNNAFAVLVTAPEGQLDGLALYTFPLALRSEPLAWYVLPAELLFTLCAWLVARIALRL